ncbi:MAG: hypothetical protein V7K27_23260 [Nostoc sp.]
MQSPSSLFNRDACGGKLRTLNNGCDACGGKLRISTSTMSKPYLEQ